MSIRWTSCICCAVAMSSVVACGSAPPKPVATKLTVIAAADVNPDSQGRASPVVLRVFQLRTDSEFTGAQFFQLYDNEKAVLGASLISRDEFTLAPAEQRQQELPVAPDARFIGVMAAYRDPVAQWRSTMPVPAKGVTNGVKSLLNERRLTIHANKTAVSLSSNE